MEPSGKPGLEIAATPRASFLASWSRKFCRALPEPGFTVQSTQLGSRAKNPMSLSGSELGEAEISLEALDGHDDVQNVYVDLSS